jgi:transposase
MPKKKMSTPYTEAFRKEAVRRSEEEGVTAVQVAKELGIHVNQIYNWRNQFRRLTERQFNTMNGVDYSKQETEEMRQLRRENAALKEEISFLKKATAYFSNQKK